MLSSRTKPLFLTGLPEGSTDGGTARRATAAGGGGSGACRFNVEALRSRSFLKPGAPAGEDEDFDGEPPILIGVPLVGPAWARLAGRWRRRAAGGRCGMNLSRVSGAGKDLRGREILEPPAADLDGEEVYTGMMEDGLEEVEEVMVFVRMNIRSGKKSDRG